jgi:hypothetical protein
MAICTRCHGYLTYGHVCRRHLETTRTSDFFLGAVLGGAVGILLFGMGGDALFGRALDMIGLITGSLSGLTLVHAINVRAKAEPAEAKEMGRARIALATP